MVLSTMLFQKPAFKNLVCNGMVLAEDGKKMSKRLKNYPVCPPRHCKCFNDVPSPHQHTQLSVLAGGLTSGQPSHQTTQLLLRALALCFEYRSTCRQRRPWLEPK